MINKKMKQLLFTIMLFFCLAFIPTFTVNSADNLTVCQYQYIDTDANQMRGEQGIIKIFNEDPDFFCTCILSEADISSDSYSWYNLQGWIKTLDVEGTSTLRLTFYDDQGIVMEEIETEPVVSTSNNPVAEQKDYVERIENVEKPSGAVKVDLELVIKGTGTVWFDSTGFEGFEPEIEQTELKLEAKFSAYPTGGTNPLEVHFIDRSTGGPTSWSWDFGDGETSTEAKPTHIYSDLGKYTVSLTVNKDSESHTKTQKDFLEVKKQVGKEVIKDYVEVKNAFAAFGETSKELSASGPTEGLELTTSGMINLVLMVLFGGGIILVIIAFVYYGIKKTKAGDNTEEAKEARKGLKGVVVGLIVLVLAFAIVKMISYLLLGGSGGIFSIVPESYRR